MLDPNLLRYQLDVVKKKLIRRGFFIDESKIKSMEKIRKQLQIETDCLQSQHKKLSKLIGQKKDLLKDEKSIYSTVSKLHKHIKILKNKLTLIKNEINDFCLEIPNIPDDSIPDGNNATFNQEILKWGDEPSYNFKVKNHIEIGQQLHGLDFNVASLMSGSRFIVMNGQIALLHRALGQFMLDVHTIQHKYIETYVPYLVNKQSLFGTGQLPKFHRDLFYVNYDYSSNNNKNYVLIPTAEVPLTNIFCNKIINESQLPIKLVAHSPCFRSESGSYGKDIKGLIRMHQFDKVELMQIVHPKKSMESLDLLTGHAEKILQLLELPYRKVLLCCGDLGFSATKTYDLEVWFPSQNMYREVSSCSNMLDFQSRRMKSRYKDMNTKKNHLLHTINGSGLAVGRTLASIMENYQCEDGRIKIPKILKDNYMRGLSYISLT
ncbi:MAG: serine--tRNA ligase [Buchnera aphidicola (Eriosoma harunire)]